MSMVTGTVKVCQPSKFGWGMKLEEDDTKWYNSKFEIKANAGDNVTFDDGGKNYVNKLKVNTGGAPAAVGTTPAPAKMHLLPVPLDNSRAIIRQNALTNAREFFTAYVGALETTTAEEVNEVIRIARLFENYTSGDADMEKAVETIKAMEVK